MSTLTARPEEESGANEEANGLCGCLHLFISRRKHQTSSNGGGGSDHAHLLVGETTSSSAGNTSKSWVVEKLMKVREVSEMVAGPKWKTLLRKIGGYFNGSNKRRRMETGYDSYDYALNFDEGFDLDDDEDEGQYKYNLGFSARFAAPFPDKQKHSAVI